MNDFIHDNIRKLTNKLNVISSAKELIDKKVTLYRLHFWRAMTVSCIFAPILTILYLYIDSPTSFHKLTTPAFLALSTLSICAVLIIFMFIKLFSEIFQAKTLFSRHLSSTLGLDNEKSQLVKWIAQADNQKVVITYLDSLGSVAKELNDQFQLALIEKNYALAATHLEAELLNVFKTLEQENNKKQLRQELGFDDDIANIKEKLINAL